MASMYNNLIGEVDWGTKCDSKGFIKRLLSAASGECLYRGRSLWQKQSCSWEPDHTLIPSLSPSFSHLFNLSFNHSWHAEQLLFSSLCSKLTLTLSHSHSLSLSHSHTLSISHSITLDMLNKFCFHLYAQKLLFIGENCNGFFGTSSSPSPVTLEFIELVPS